MKSRMTPSRAKKRRKQKAVVTLEATAKVVPVVALPVPPPPAAALVAQNLATRSPKRKMSELDFMNCVLVWFT